MIKNLLTLRHAIIVCLACLSLSAFAQEGDPRYVYPENGIVKEMDADYLMSEVLYTCQVGNKVGIVDRFKDVIIPIEYDEIKHSGVYYDYFLIRQGNNWGLINKHAEFILPPVLAYIRYDGRELQFIVREHDGHEYKLDYADLNSYGAFFAGKYKWGKWFFIREDENTKIIYVDDYWTSGEFSDGMMPIRDAATFKLGFINAKGEWAVPCKMQYASNEYYIPGLNKKLDFHNGCLVLTPQYNHTGVYDHSGNRLWSIASLYNEPKTGQVVSNHVSDYVKGGYALMRTSRGGKDVYKYVSPTGKNIFPNLTRQHYVGRTTELDARPMREGLAAFLGGVVSKNGGERDYKWGFFDKNGTVVIPEKYNAVHDFHEGLAAVQMTGIDENPYKWGFIDKTGKMVIPARFSKEPSDFSEGLAVVEKANETKVFIDKTGKVVSIEFADAEPFLNGAAFVAVNIDGNWTNFAVDHTFNPVGSYLGDVLGTVAREQYKAARENPDIKVDLFQTMHDGCHDSRGEKYFMYGQKPFTIEHVTEGIVHVRYGKYEKESEDYFCDQTGRVIFILRRNEF